MCWLHARLVVQRGDLETANASYNVDFRRDTFKDTPPPLFRLVETLTHTATVRRRILSLFVSDQNHGREASALNTVYAMTFQKFYKVVSHI